MLMHQHLVQRMKRWNSFMITKLIMTQNRRSLKEILMQL